MGNLKFRLSNMMPNSWFYKLRDMGRTKSQSTSNSTRKKQATSTSTVTPQKSKPNHHPRKSYYITRDLIPNHTFQNSPTNPNTHFPDPPRKSSKQRARAGTRSRTTRSSSPKLVTSSVSAGCICRFDSAWKISDSSPENSSLELCQTLPPAEFRSDRILVTHHQSFDKMVSWSSSCKCRANSDANGIVIDIDNKSFANKFDEVDGFYAIPDLELPPIITRPGKFNDMVRDIKKKETKEAIKPRRRSAKFEEEKINLREHKNSNVGRLSASSPGVRLRINSPKIRGRRIQDERRRQTQTDLERRSRLSNSFAMVKSSCDPQTDFRKSMVEMIVENNIRESKDLEELLACYLSLNSDEYHDLIIKVFKQIWLDLN